DLRLWCWCGRAGPCAAWMPHASLQGCIHGVSSTATPTPQAAPIPATNGHNPPRMKYQTDTPTLGTPPLRSPNNEKDPAARRRRTAGVVAVLAGADRTGRLAGA